MQVHVGVDVKDVTILKYYVSIFILHSGWPPHLYVEAQSPFYIDHIQHFRLY